MRNDEILRTSLPSSLSSGNFPKPTFNQPLHGSPVQPNTASMSSLFNRSSLPTSDWQPTNIRLHGSEKGPGVNFLRQTVNPTEKSLPLKKQFSAHVETTPFRQPQSTYSMLSVNTTNPTIRKKSDAVDPSIKSSIPFSNWMTLPLKHQDSKSELDRPADIRTKVPTMSERPKPKQINLFKSSFGLPAKAEQRIEPKTTQHQEKSYYSDIYSDSSGVDIDRSIPMFKKMSLEFPSESRTPQSITKSPQMNPKRNTDILTMKQEKDIMSPLSPPSSANFKKPRMPFTQFDSFGLSLQQFQIVKFLGEGRFGKVELVRHKQTKSIYALKKISKWIVKTNKLQKQVINEIKLQMYLDSPYITKLYGFFHDHQFFYLIMEYMQQGTLYDKIQILGGKFKEEDIAMTTFEISNGIQMLDDMDIAHRDIKPENILLSVGCSKISDFGLACICRDRRTTEVNTPAYLSPEMAEGRDYDQRIDLWCLGVLVYEMFTGKVPFTNQSKKQTERLIKNADVSKIVWKAGMSEAAKDFISRLLKKNPQQRISAQNLLVHPFLKNVMEFDI